MDHPAWLPAEYHDVTDPWQIVDLLNSPSFDSLHPMQCKYALMEWSKYTGAKIGLAMIEALGVRRGE